MFVDSSLDRFPVIVFYIPGFDTKFLDITKQIDGSSVKTCRRDNLVPAYTIFKMAFMIAAIPEAQAIEAMPPSSFVILFSNAVTVGFPTRV